MVNDNYKQKYEKYKSKYLNLRKEIIKDKYGQYIDNKYSKLFYDLLEASEGVLKLTSNTDFIILIGDTPSYLKPFLEDKSLSERRTVFNLPFSNLPYFCFMQPHGNPYPIESVRSLIPTKKGEQQYFNYLNKNTVLTKKFVKDNWYKIVLIDLSIGPTVHGASIFLNRYIGNIKKDQDCTDINGATPLRFISLEPNLKGIRTNIKPEYSIMLEKETNCYHLNYIPSLIILTGRVIFRSAMDFAIKEKYPRYVPTYIVYFWDRPPYKDDYKEKFKEGLKLLDTITKMLKEHISFSQHK